MAKEEDVFDIVVIGGGPAGEVAGQYAVRDTGASCALVESELLGGECSYWACMPSKALLRPLDVAGAARNLDGLAGVRVEASGLLDRRDVWRSGLDDSGQATWAKDAGLRVVRGRGRLAGERVVDVETDAGTHRLRARHAVVLATGSVPVIPDALASVQPWTTRDATGVIEVPDRIAIVGGGVVACEAATWLSGLGSDVSMLVRGERLLSRLEPFAAETVADGLREAGVDLRFGTTVTNAARDALAEPVEVGVRHGGPVRLSLGEDILVVDEVLSATGRRPSFGDLGLDAVGLGPDDLDGGVHVRDGWLYAVGDVSGAPKLTHWGKYQGRRVGAMIAARMQGEDAAAPPADVPVPQVVFSQPQVASVGLTLAEGESAGRGVRAVDRPLTDAAGFGLLRDDASGQARLVLEGDHLVGATFAGTDVAELLHAATVAIVGRVPLQTLAHAVPAYPTVSEIWLGLVDAALRE